MGPPIADPSSYGELDEQITCLMRCQPLPEADVKTLCDKAREILVSVGVPAQRWVLTSKCGVQ